MSLDPVSPTVRLIYISLTDYVITGHGAPAILSCLWLEDSLSTFLPQYPQNKTGLTRLISGFSTPSGFPSHINAETPGSIHEGGELGYALSVAFGAVMDNPDLIVACVVGDGEAETGPTATYVSFLPLPQTNIHCTTLARGTDTSILIPQSPVP